MIYNSPPELSVMSKVTIELTFIRIRTCDELDSVMVTYDWEHNCELKYIILSILSTVVELLEA